VRALPETEIKVQLGKGKNRLGYPFSAPAARTTRPTTSPVANPPTWAHHATPPPPGASDTEASAPLANWRRNQKRGKKKAGMSTTRMKMKIGTSVRTLACG